LSLKRGGDLLSMASYVADGRRKRAAEQGRGAHRGNHRREPECISIVVANTTEIEGARIVARARCATTSQVGGGDAPYHSVHKCAYCQLGRSHLVKRGHGSSLGP
jgi:hypothetical protein